MLICFGNNNQFWVFMDQGPFFRGQSLLRREYEKVTSWLRYLKISIVDVCPSEEFYGCFSRIIFMERCRDSNEMNAFTFLVMNDVLAEILEIVKNCINEVPFSYPRPQMYPWHILASQMSMILSGSVTGAASNWVGDRQNRNRSEGFEKLSSEEHRWNPNEYEKILRRNYDSCSKIHRRSPHRKSEQSKLSGGVSMHLVTWIHFLPADDFSVNSDFGLLPPPKFSPL